MENRCAVWNDRQEDGCREGHCTPGARAPEVGPPTGWSIGGRGDSGCLDHPQRRILLSGEWTLTQSTEYIVDAQSGRRRKLWAKGVGGLDDADGKIPRGRRAWG